LPRQTKFFFPSLKTKSVLRKQDKADDGQVLEEVYKGSTETAGWVGFIYLSSLSLIDEWSLVNSEERFARILILEPILGSSPTTGATAL